VKFWDVVIVTAFSERKPALYRNENPRRRLSGMLPEDAQYLVPVPIDERAGCGGATVHELAVLAKGRERWSEH
jgi:hypothetical protein